MRCCARTARVLGGLITQALAAACAILVLASPANAGVFDRVTENAEGDPLTFRGIEGHVLSGDGRYSAFASEEESLMPDGPGPLRMHVFVRDNDTGAIERVSVSTDGTPANGWSHDPAISADGRLVAFLSSASNLAPGPADGDYRTFLHNRETGVTEMVSVSSDEEPADIGDEQHQARAASISDDGRLVAFTSWAGNLHPQGGASGDGPTVFVRDRQLGTTEFVGHGGNGTISGDGRYVAFETGAQLDPSDQNIFDDIYLHDRQDGSTEAVSVDDTEQVRLGHSMFPDLAADGRTIAFLSTADLEEDDDNGTWDLYLRDLDAGGTERISVDGDGTGRGYLSGDGRLLAFSSVAADLVPGDANGERDVFLRDLTTDEIELLSVDVTGEQGNDESRASGISADGSVIAVSSDATNLIEGESGVRFQQYIAEDNCPDVFNPDQLDADGNRQGDACEIADGDEDGVADENDNCPAVANADQANNEGDAEGDACDADDDNDWDPDTADNCELIANGDQANFDADTLGDACDSDDDNDTFADVADEFPFDPDEWVDSDADEIGDNGDNCPAAANPDQLDGDGDGLGDACDLAAPPDPSAGIPDTDADPPAKAKKKNCKKRRGPRQAASAKKCKRKRR